MQCGSGSPPNATPSAPDGSPADVGAERDSSSNDASDAALQWTSVTEIVRGDGILVEKVLYPSDGLSIEGQICRPNDGAKHPVLVVNHGGFLGLTTELYTGALKGTQSLCLNAAASPCW